MVQKTLADGTTVEAYPLTQAQRFMYFAFNTFGKAPAVLNIATGHYWKGYFDRDLLFDSLTEAINRCDSMRLRFTPDQQFGLVQYLAKESGIVIDEVDHTKMTDAQSYEVCKSWAREDCGLFDKPINTVKIMHLPDGHNGFFIRFHHLAFDGYSSRAFIADVMAIYVSKMNKTAYPKPLRGYVEAMQREIDYLNGERIKADREFWTKYYAERPEPIFNDYMLNNRLDAAKLVPGQENTRSLELFNNDAASGTLKFDLTAEETQQIISACEKNNITLPCAIMMGLRTALSAFNHNQPDVSFKFMIHRRATLLDKKSGGNRWHLYTIRSIVSPDETFAEANDTVESAQDEIFHHADFDPLEMLKIKHSALKLQSFGQTYDSLSFSYHAPVEIPAVNDEAKASSIGEWYNSDFSTQNLYLTAKHRVADNGLQFIFEYRLSESPVKDLTVLFEKMMQTIKIGLANPNVTVGEILEKIKL